MRLKRVLATFLASGFALGACVLAGPTRATSDEGAGVGVAAAEAYTVSADSVARRLRRKQRVVFLDTRQTIDGDTIRGAVNVPPDVVAAWARRADKRSYIVTYCTCDDDGLALQAAGTLRSLGFTNAWALSGGLDAARSAGIPLGPLAR